MLHFISKDWYIGLLVSDVAYFSIYSGSMTFNSSFPNVTDKAAKAAATNGEAQTARRSSLAHINRNIKEATKFEVYTWHRPSIGEREARSEDYYVLPLKPGIHPVPGHASRRYASTQITGNGGEKGGF